MDKLAKNKALEVQAVKAAEAELKRLETIRKKYAKTTEEKRMMNEKIYKAQQNVYALEIAQIEYRRSIGKITHEEALRQMIELDALYAKKNKKKGKMSKDQQREAQVAAHERTMELLQISYDKEKKQLDRSVAEGKISLDQRIKQLEEYRKKYKDNADIVEAIDDALYDAQREKYTEAYKDRHTALDRAMREGKLTHEQYIKELRKMLELYRDDLIITAELQGIIYDEEDNARQKRLANMYKEIEDMKDAGKLTKQDELDRIKAIGKQFAITEDEKIDNADRQRRLVNAMRWDAFNEEIKRIERLRSEGKLSTAQTIAEMEKVRAAYADHIDMRNQMDETLYNLGRELWQERTDNITSVAGALLEALKNQYTQMRDAEKQALKESQQGWKDWAKGAKDEIKATYDAKIKALDDMLKAEDEAARDEEELRRIAELKLQLAHERDAENQYQLQQQILAAEKARADRLRKLQADQQKEALQAERDAMIEDTDKANEAAQAELEDKLKLLDEYWDDRLDTQKLRGEVERMLVEDDQVKMLKLLEEFNKDYDAIGKSWGEKLVDGFGEKIMDIAAQAKAAAAQVQKVMEDSLRGYQATASPTSANALANNDAANPGQVINNYYTITGSTNMSEAEFKALLDRINREMALL